MRSPLEVDGDSKPQEPGEGEPSAPTTVTEERGGFLKLIICCFPSCSINPLFFFPWRSQSQQMAPSPPLESSVGFSNNKQNCYYLKMQHSRKAFKE